MSLYCKKSVILGVAVGTLSVALSGCVVHNVDPMVTHRATCLDYGFKYGSPEYAKCIQKEQLSAKKNRAKSYQAQPTYYAPAPVTTTFVGSYYKADSFHDRYAIDRELARLKKESKRRRHEAAYIRENRLRQDELLRLQREKIRFNELKLQNQHNQEIRREQERYRQDQERYRQEAKRKQEQSDYALAARLQAEEFEKERKRLEREREQQRQQENYSRIQQQELVREQEMQRREAEKARMQQQEMMREQEKQRREAERAQRQLEEVRRQRDKAEQAHVQDLFRRQEEERQRQARNSGTTSHKSAVQQQIDSDHELALALQKEEYGM